MENAKTLPIFNLKIPSKVEGVKPEILDPRNSWDDESVWNIKAEELAKLFINNFNQFCDNVNGRDLVNYGPQLP